MLTQTAHRITIATSTSHLFIDGLRAPFTHIDLKTKGTAELDLKSLRYVISAATMQFYDFFSTQVHCCL